MQEIFTIGHSNHTTQTFIDLLRKNGINAIADVRSSPRTKVNPDFCQPELERVLRDHGFSYVFLGEELGARSANEDCYEEGRVSYGKLAQQTNFHDGLDRIEIGSEKFRIALMCAEKEPLDCHRCILVARHLVARGLVVNHILANGTSETHNQTILRLKASLSLLDQRDIFQSDDDLTELAYSLQEKKIAYQLPEQTIPRWVA